MSAVCRGDASHGDGHPHHITISIVIVCAITRKMLCGTDALAKACA
jgi:hypothetical protein